MLPTEWTPEAERHLNRVLDRLDTEDNDTVRADLIDEALDILDRYPALAPIARAAGLPA